MPDPTFTDLPILGELGLQLDAAMALEPAASPAAESNPTNRVTAPRRRRPWPWHASGRPLPTVVVALLLAGLGTSTAAATLTVLRGSPIPIPKALDVQPVMTPRTGSEQLLLLRAVRPGGGAPFALRTGVSETGLTCVTVGQVQGTRFGVNGTDGLFRDMPSQVVDGCGKLATGKPAVLGARVFDSPQASDVRTVVYGVAGPDLRRADLQRRGVWTPVHVQAGHFVEAVRGYPEDSSLRLRLTFEGGKSTVFPVGVGTNMATDPTGPAWHFEAGSTQGQGTLCLTVFPARSHIGSAAPAPVCGRVKGPRNYELAAPYVLSIRTLRPGDRGGPQHGPSLFGQSWNWHHHPSRTFVYGFADRNRVKLVRIHAPGGRAFRPTANGAFVLVLPGSVSATSVRVDFVMKRGKTRSFDRSVNTTGFRVHASKGAPR